jgi:hypothetical protein
LVWRWMRKPGKRVGDCSSSVIAQPERNRCTRGPRAWAGCTGPRHSGILRVVVVGQCAGFLSSSKR